MSDDSDQTVKSHRKTTGMERWKVVFIFLLVLALPLLWRSTPLYEWFNVDSIMAWQESVKNHRAAPFYVIGAYLIGSLFFFPITVLNLATVFAFGPVWGNFYALVGWLLSSAEGYCLGRGIGKDLIFQLAGRRLEPLIQAAERHGFFAVLAMRVVPVGPFTLVNLFIGASGIRFSDFFCASLIGRLPGILVLTLFGVQLESALRNPKLTSFAALIFVLFVVPFLISRLSRHFSAPKRRKLHRTGTKES